MFSYPLNKTLPKYLLNQMSRDIEKQTKWHLRPAKTQISLGIHPVWSESSLSAWSNLRSLATHWAHSEHSDQTGRMLRHNQQPTPDTKRKRKRTDNNACKINKQMQRSEVITLLKGPKKTPEQRAGIANRPYETKSSQRVVFKIPISSLIVRRYRLLGRPCCVTTLW